ncbi:MAG: hypothetical protein KDE27_15255 [Planctomycetes bacterium]|nr:hypothetical protein [Planctomycetota bacterium]
MRGQDSESSQVAESRYPRLRVRSPAHRAPTRCSQTTRTHMNTLRTLFAAALLPAAALQSPVAGQSGQTLFTIVDAGPLAGPTRSVEALAFPPAVPTATRTVLGLPPAIPAASVTAIAALGLSTAAVPNGAIVVLGTGPLAGPFAEIHVLRFVPGANTLAPITLNVGLPSAVVIRDLHRTDTGCVLVLAEDQSANPLVYRVSATPNGTTFNPLLVPLSGLPLNVAAWSSIGSGPNGNVLIAGQTTTGGTAAFSAPTQGGALTGVGGGAFLGLAVEADLTGSVHVGGAPPLTPLGASNAACGGFPTVLGPINPTGIAPVVADLEVVAGTLPGLATGVAFGNLLVAISSIISFSPQGARSTSIVYRAGGVGPPPCPLTTAALVPLFAYPAPLVNEVFAVRKIAFWDAMNSYGCECAAAGAGGRPILVGTDATGAPSAFASRGSSYNVFFGFDAPGVPPGATASVLNIGANPIAFPLGSPVNGGGSKVCDVLDDFFNTGTGGVSLSGFGVPATAMFNIPNDPTLAGAILYFQGATATGAELVTSPALFVTIL